MTKTLADMTVKERQACVGMWCDLETNKGTQQVVLYKMVEEHETGPVAYRLSFTSRHEILGFDPENLTPRFDLPRSWNPDGTPVKGEWEEGWCYTGGTPTGDYACLIETQEGTAYTSEETPTGDIRRFIHEWENTNE